MSPEDTLALHDLVHRYAAYVDDRDLDRAAALFTLDGVLVPARREPVAGRPAVRKALGALERVRRTAHEIGGIVLDRTGPHAVTGRVTAVAHHVDEGTDHVWHLVYRDEYRRIAGHWFFARRELDLRFTEERQVGR
ncbi:nuclear transport factor 2 family protein [Nocardioides lianchengensis]|uniref:SnoaL-like domain-containing protein n=1 Tax=Nocardioides lianchengensis TaxID=1045774 RepID=A0A1G6PPV8_9ACTN|nr:nuclear transport factor 2 family protein [Nocardioides lianchengensis]NYG11910.1 ketosteroid isomerase-like protein [Nocardioides lianchengensis]SDC81405.1 SnoaL-like domain-containing protein [Nocardioides lianchengensis]